MIGGKIERCTGYFRPDGLYVEDKSLQTIGVKAFFPVKYFTSYKVEGEEEKLCLSKSLLEPFSWTEAFEQSKFRVFIKGNKLRYEGLDKQGKIKDSWEDDLGEIEEHKFSFLFPMTEKGLIPTGKSDKPEQSEILQVLLRASQLKVHTTDRYKFTCDEQQIELEVTNPGVYRRILELTKTSKLSKFELAYPEELETIVGLLTGDVWLTFFKGPAVFSQKTEEGAVTFLLSPLSEA